MEKRLISHELEEMKIQIDNLKKKLEDQTIVNEKHIRNSFRTKISDINMTVTMTVIVGILSLVYCTWFYHSKGLSLAFTIATGLMLAVCVLLTLIQKIQLSRIDISAGNLVETARDISKIRTHYKHWYKTAIPMIIIWFGWMTYEILTRFEMTPMTIGFLSGSATGAIFGGIIGSRINKKIINRTEELLGYIEELQKEN